jgi:hypothetical protein
MQANVATPDWNIKRKLMRVNRSVASKLSKTGVI